jgi:predicted TIM-barrel fold metal-dependent hydrolase
MINIFDCNMHLTRTESFKDYQKNMPVTFSNYKLQYGNGINLVGCLHTGLPDFESYSLESFADLSLQSDTFMYAFPALTKDALLNLDEFLLMVSSYGFKGCKIHPRLLQSRLSADALVDIYTIFNKHGISIMLCSLCLGNGFSNIMHLEYLKFLEYFVELEVRNAKIIIAHGGGSWFFDYYEIARYCPDILLDLSFSLVRYWDILRDRFFYAIAEDRNCLAFGTDWPDYSLNDCLHILSPLINSSMPKIALSNFLANNALNFLRSL